LPGHAELPHFAIVEVLEADFQRVDLVLPLLLTAAAATTPSTAAVEHHVKDVAGVSSLATAHSFFSELIVLGTLLLVPKDIIGLGDLLEGVRVAALVRMMLDRELAVSLAETG